MFGSIALSQVLLSPWVFMPVVGGIIGWATNYVAVRMLFHPAKPYWVLGFNMQGVFPKRQAALARKLGEVVAEQLISGEEVGQQLKSPAVRERVRSAVDRFLERAIRERLPQAVPMVAMFLTPQLIDTVLGAFRADLDGFIDQALIEIGSQVGSGFDIKGVVEAKVAAFSSDRLESMLLELMSKELKFVELVGGVLGALIGVAQAGITVALL